MTTDDVTERARQIVTGAMFGLTTPTMVDAIVSGLADAGLLATPEHDAAVAAKALRGVARALDAEDSSEWADAADQEAVRIIRLIRDEADRIEDEGGAS